MTSRALRRRLHHGDVDGKRHEHLETSGLDGLDEPLLGNHDYDETCSEMDICKAKIYHINMAFLTLGAGTLNCYTSNFQEWCVLYSCA
ncbi:hypothetical protein LOK49_LG04G03517 [Camellia lanceoleosa]|uniref:Uncharacterized protein n=1 Tax=Camellia lanceoleosa TaxID=1840588 RepID=A0ACC0HXQ2_9ERIC|nr:hypothetical protein LOK49_LG04G03517 [Camellia lanceoleosa]